MADKRIFNLSLASTLSGKSLAIDVGGNPEAERVLLDSFYTNENVRAASQAVTAGNQTINFSSAFSDSNYVLFADVRDPSGQIIGNFVTSKTNSTFDINPSFAGTLNYIAVKL